MVVLLIAQVPLLQVSWQSSKIVLQAVLCVLQAKAAAQDFQLWNSYQLPWSELVPNSDCAVLKSEAGQL